MGFYLPGHTLSQHLTILQTYKGALATGTWKNKCLHVTVFLSFCREHEVDPLHPTEYDILAFLIHLTTRLRAPGSVFNYFSSVKTWFSGITGSSSLFDSYHVKTLKKGVTKLLNHTVNRVVLLSPKDLSKVVHLLWNAGSDNVVFIVALLLTYLTLVRQSNVVSLTSDVLGPHTSSQVPALC